MPFNNLPADMKRQVAHKLPTKDISALQRVNQATKTALDPVMKHRKLLHSIDVEIKAMSKDDAFHDTWTRIRRCLAWDWDINDDQIAYNTSVDFLGFHLRSQYKWYKDAREHRYWVGLYGMYKIVKLRATELMQNWIWQGPDPSPEDT